MNRELKFRVWAEDHMVYLTQAGLQYFDFEGNYALSFVVDGYSGFWGHENYEKCSELANTFPIMQFTGLLDKHGKEIYEGDILKSERGHQGTVEWEPAIASFFINCKDGAWSFNEGNMARGLQLEYTEIIGDIYQTTQHENTQTNPETRSDQSA